MWLQWPFAFDSSSLTTVQFPVGTSLVFFIQEYVFLQTGAARCNPSHAKHVQIHVVRVRSTQTGHNLWNCLTEK